MRALLITYDLHKPGRDYASLFDAIKRVGTGRCHVLESVWVVTTSSSSVDVRDQIRGHLDANDSLLVTPVGGSWASIGLSQQVTGWLNANL